MTEKDEKIKYRNLKKDEQKKVISAFTDILKNIKINHKPLVVNATTKSIAMNPQISMEEMQKTLKINEKTKLDFIRQLYVRSGSKIISQLFPEEHILNLPVISFEENGNLINLNF
jgi:hypothetical protein